MQLLWLVVLVLTAMSTAGCELVGDIFQAGVWVGVVVVVLVLAVIGVVAAKLRG